MARTSKASGGAKKTAQPRSQAAAKSTAKPAKSAAASVASAKPAAKRDKSGLENKLNPNRLLAELVGTFILTLVVIAALSGKFVLSFFTTPEVAAQAAQVGQQIPSFMLTAFVAGLALIVLVLATYKISGGHLNPAVTVGQMALRRQHWAEGVGYIIAQVLGAMLAIAVATSLISVLDPATGQTAPLTPATLFSHAVGWKIFFAELLGAFVFGFAVAAAFGYRDLARAFTYGGAFVIGLGVAFMAGAGVLNPALAVGIGLIGFGSENLWALAGIYLGGSTLGVLIGMAFHALLNRDVALEDNKDTGRLT